MLSTFPEVVIYLLHTYTPDVVIAEADQAFTRFTQPLAMSPTEYVESMVARSFRCEVLR